MKRLKVKNMSSFQLSAHIDANKVFLVSRSNLKNRWDPKKVFFSQKYSKSPYEIATLGKLLQISPQYGANERGIERTSKNQPRYIRITDINSFGELSNDMGVTAENCEQQYFLNHNDLLIARSGNTVGKSYIHNIDKNSQEKFLFAGYMIRFIVNSNIALPLYVFLFTQLSVYKRWVEAIQRVAGQPNINAEEYRSLELPLPPLKEQKNITNKYIISLETKQKKEQEAQDLLDSIDDYLIQELGIELPEVDNSLENRVFKTSSRKIINSRWDTRYHSYFNLLLEQNFKHEIMCLRNVVNISPQYGLNDSAINPEKETDIRFIRITDIDNNGNLKSDNWKTVLNPLPQYLLEKNDILFARSGSVGRCYIHQDLSRQAVFAGYLIRFKVITNKINPLYLFYYCNTSFYKKWVEAIERPSVQSNINAQEFMSLPLILPSLREQNQIVAHIQSIREQAKQLQHEAQQQFEDAKKEIERMILGGDL